MLTLTIHSPYVPLTFHLLQLTWFCRLLLPQTLPTTNLLHMTSYTSDFIDTFPCNFVTFSIPHYFTLLVKPKSVITRTNRHKHAQEHSSGQLLHTHTHTHTHTLNSYIALNSEDCPHLTDTQATGEKNPTSHVLPKLPHLPAA